MLNFSTYFKILILFYFFALSYYSLVEDDFVRPRKGEYIVYVGSSAGINDLNLTTTVNADF